MEIKVIALGIILIAQGAMAQQAVDDIRRINSTLSGSEQLAIALSYNVYPDSVSKVALQSSEGKWIKNGASQYHRLGDIETIRKAGAMQVVIDHENKIVVLSNAPDLDNGNVPDFTMTGSMEALLEQCKAVKYRSVNALLAAYDLYPMESEYSKLTIVFDRKKFYPVKMILQHGNVVAYTEGEEERETAPRIEIDFKIRTVSSDQLSLVDISNYVFKKENAYLLTAPYKEYEFNNYLITN